MKQFEAGKTYQTRSICDHECIFSFTIISRTKKFVTLKAQGEIKKVGVKDLGEWEWAFPLGRYSMAPMIRADREIL
jgi:hypothetical protein